MAEIKRKFIVILGVISLLLALIPAVPIPVFAAANCGIADPITCTNTPGCQWTGSSCVAGGSAGGQTAGCSSSGLTGASCCYSFPGDPVCLSYCQGSPNDPACAGVTPSYNPTANGNSSVGGSCPGGTSPNGGLCVPTGNCPAGSICGQSTLAGLMLQIINYLLIFAGIIAVIALIIGGYWYITAAGNEEQAEKGRKALLNAIIGLVIILLAYAIVNIVIKTLTTTNPLSNS